MPEPPYADDARARVIAYWSDPAHAASPDTVLDHPLVRAYMSLRALGEIVPHLSAVAQQIQQRTAPGARILSVACGTAGKEIALAGLVPDRSFVGVDIAEASLAQAESAAAAAGRANVTFALADLDHLDAAELGASSFDLILGLGAIHHVAALEGFWRACRRLLRPGGAVIAQEYVGPNRFQWTDRQIELCDRALAELVPPEHKVHHDRVQRTPLETMLRLDPSEAVRSEDILTTCRAEFELEAYGGGGCGLLQPILVYQSHTYDPRDWRHNLVLARLFEREDEHMRRNELGDAYAMFVLR
jgi:SAM-dependent methyltransferase